MSFDWLEYLQVAQELAEQAKKSSSAAEKEAKVRAAISRAYYAAFGMARNHLRDKEKIPEPRPLVNKMNERVNIHRYVREKFQYSNDSVRQEIGHTLERMCDNRNVADYDKYTNLFDNPTFITQVTLRWAKDVISALKRL